jgi:hypothetical protein
MNILEDSKTMDLEIYKKLFYIVRDNLIDSGDDLEYSKDVFLSSISVDPFSVNISDILKLDNISFIQTLYIHLFNRICDEGALKTWKRNADMNEKNFQEKAVKTLLHSQEFRDKNAKIYNNIYSNKSTTEQYVTVINNFYNGRFYKIYNKMPKSIKEIIKKLFKWGWR